MRIWPRTKYVAINGLLVYLPFNLCLRRFQSWQCPMFVKYKYNVYSKKLGILALSQGRNSLARNNLSGIILVRVNPSTHLIIAFNFVLKSIHSLTSINFSKWSKWFTLETWFNIGNSHFEVYFQSRRYRCSQIVTEANPTRTSEILEFNLP